MESIQNDNEIISLKKIIVYYLRQWKLFVIAACISIIPAVLYLMLYPKTYEIMSRIKLQEDKDLAGGGSVGLGEAAGLMKSFGMGGSSVAAVNIDDEIATLQSNWLLTKVVLQLGLNVTYEKPYSLVQLYEHSPLLVTPDSVTKQSMQGGVSFKIDVNADSSAKLKIERTGEVFSFSSLPAQLILPEGEFTIAYRESVNAPKPFSLNVSVSPAGWVAEDLSDVITIEEFSKNSNILEISCVDYERVRGKELLNALMSEYNKNSDTIKKEESYKTMSFLDGRIQGIMQELNNVERTVENYKIANKMTDIEFDVKFYGEAVKNFREKIIEIEAQSHIVNLLDTYVTDPKNKYNLIPAMLSAGEGEKGGAISSYNEALIERDRLMKTSKSDNPLLEIMNNQVDKLRGSVVLSIDNIRKSSQMVLTDLKSQEKMIMDKMGNVPTYEREYLDLRRQQEILQGVYLILLQKREEVALSLGQERDRGFIIDAAFVKYMPIGPRKLYAAIFMILFTILVPVGYLFGKEQLFALVKEYKNSKN